MKKKAHSCSVFGPSSPIHTIDVFERKMLKLIHRKITRALIKTRRERTLTFLSSPSSTTCNGDQNTNNTNELWQWRKVKLEKILFFTNGSGRHGAVK
jgi:hypothetical protein